MKSLERRYIERLAFNNQDLATLKKLGEYRGRQGMVLERPPETLEALRMVAVVESAESSNRLEGVKTSRERLKGIVLKKTAPRDRDEQEIAGYRDALALVHEHYQDLKFDLDTIRLMHSTTFKYLPISAGKWKKTQNYIIEDMPKGKVRIRFEPVEPERTPEAMEALVRFYEQTNPGAADPLVLIPAAVLDFLCIHPFSDGNGRVARLLGLLLLYQSDITVGRYISLERIFEESKVSYYETLERSSIGWHNGEHDVMPWTRYFWGVLISAYKELEQRVGSVKTSRGAKTELVITTVKNSPAPISVSEILDACPGVSRETVKRVLKMLRDKGLIEATGIGKGAKWRKMPNQDWNLV